MRKVIQKECSKHGLTRYIEEKDGYHRCAKCRSNHVTEWRRKIKAKLVEEFGGKCKLCGYCKCQQALQFHHLNPNDKCFAISKYGNTRAYETMLNEAKKCMLLCANCHAEVENGICIIEEV